MRHNHITVPRGFDSFFYNNDKSVLEKVIKHEKISHESFEDCVEEIWDNYEAYAEKYSELSYFMVVDGKTGEAVSS